MLLPNDSVVVAVEVVFTTLCPLRFILECCRDNQCHVYSNLQWFLVFWNLFFCHFFLLTLLKLYFTLSVFNHVSLFGVEHLDFQNYCSLRSKLKNDTSNQENQGLWYIYVFRGLTMVESGTKHNLINRIG